MSDHAATGGNIEHSQRSLEAILKAIGVPLAIAVAAAIWFTKTPDALSLQGHKALALFGGIFVLYLTETIPLAIASLLVVPIAVLTGTANLRTALDGFSASPVYLIVGAFILATAMVKTRLAERITYIILTRFGSAPTRITLGVTLVNIALAFLVPFLDSAHGNPAARVPEHSRDLRVRRAILLCDKSAPYSYDDQCDDRRGRPHGYGTYMVGFLKDVTGSFDAGMIGMAIILVIGTGVAAALKLVTQKI